MVEWQETRHSSPSSSRCLPRGLSTRIFFLFAFPPVVVGILLVVPLSGSFDANPQGASFGVYVGYFQSIYTFVSGCTVLLLLVLAQPPLRRLWVLGLGIVFVVFANFAVLMSCGASCVEQHTILNTLGGLFLVVFLPMLMVYVTMTPESSFDLSEIERRQLLATHAVIFEDDIAWEHYVKTSSYGLPSDVVSTVAKRSERSLHDPLLDHASKSSTDTSESGTRHDDVWIRQESEGSPIWYPMRQTCVAIVVLVELTLLYYFCQITVRSVGTSENLSRQAALGLAFQLGMWFGRIVVWYTCSFFNFSAARCCISHAYAIPTYFFLFLFYRTLFEEISSYTAFAVLQVEHVGLEILSYLVLSLRPVYIIQFRIIRKIKTGWRCFYSKCLCCCSDNDERELFRKVQTCYEMNTLFTKEQSKETSNEKVEDQRVGDEIQIQQVREEEATFVPPLQSSNMEPSTLDEETLTESWNRYLRQLATEYVVRWISSCMATINFLLIVVVISNTSYLDPLFSFVSQSSRENLGSIVYPCLAISVVIEFLVLLLLRFGYRRLYKRDLFALWTCVVNNDRMFCLFLIAGAHIATDAVIARVYLKFS